MQETQALLFSPPEFKDGTFYGSWPPFHMLGKSQLLVPVFSGGRAGARATGSSTGEFWDDVRTYGVTSAYTVSVIASFLYGDATTVG